MIRFLVWLETQLDLCSDYHGLFVCSRCLSGVVEGCGVVDLSVGASLFHLIMKSYVIISRGLV